MKRIQVNWGKYSTWTPLCHCRLWRYFSTAVLFQSLFWFVSFLWVDGWVGGCVYILDAILVEKALLIFVFVSFIKRLWNKQKTQCDNDPCHSCGAQKYRFCSSLRDFLFVYFSSITRWSERHMFDSYFYTFRSVFLYAFNYCYLNEDHALGLMGKWLSRPHDVCPYVW